MARWLMSQNSEAYCPLILIFISRCSGEQKNLNFNHLQPREQQRTSAYGFVVYHRESWRLRETATVCIYVYTYVCLSSRSGPENIIHTYDMYVCMYDQLHMHALIHTVCIPYVSFVKKPTSIHDDHDAIKAVTRRIPLSVSPGR